MFPWEGCSKRVGQSCSMLALLVGKHLLLHSSVVAVAVSERLTVMGCFALKYLESKSESHDSSRELLWREIIQASVPCF